MSKMEKPSGCFFQMISVVGLWNCSDLFFTGDLLSCFLFSCLCIVHVYSVQASLIYHFFVHFC